MGFDFDDLEESSAVKIPEIVPMSDDAFAQIGRRIRAVVDSGTYKELDDIVAEALWGMKVPADRVSSIVKELLDILVKVADLMDEFGEDAADDRVFGGFAVMHVLFRFSLSLSQDGIVKHAGSKGSNERVALILGSAGTSIRDLQAQADFYNAHGFATLSLTRCVFPMALQRYQELRLAQELQELLTERSKLLVHACGSHGHAMWSNLASLWQGGEEPFSDLPALKDCLHALVWECGPAGDASLKAFEPDKPQPGSELEDAAGIGSVSELSLEQAYNLQKDLYTNYSRSKFQDQLDKLEDKFDRGSAKFIAARNKLFLEAQIPVLQRYGFQGNQKGVYEMLHVCSRFNKDPVYAQNRDRLNRLLELNLVTPSEHQRRLEAGYNEMSSSQKAKQGEAATRISSRHFKYDYQDDATGMCKLVDACFRALLQRHLPGTDPGILMQSNPEIRTLILGAARHGAFWLGGDYGLKTDSGQSLWGDFAEWIAIDAAIKPPVPRLFLYSRRDELIPDHAVERYIRSVEEYNPDAELIVEKFPDGAHMRLWQMNRKACEEVVHALMGKAGLLLSTT